MEEIVDEEVINEEVADELEDEEIGDYLTAVINRVYNDFEGPIDMHVRTDRINVTVVVCRNDPIEVHFYCGNAKDYYDCEEDADESLEETLITGSIDQPFEAEMLSRAFIEHILLNPERQNPSTGQPETVDHPERIVS